MEKLPLEIQQKYFYICLILLQIFSDHILTSITDMEVIYIIDVILWILLSS